MGLAEQSSLMKAQELEKRVMTYPRIWNDRGELTIAGETKVSWIVVQRGKEGKPWVSHVTELYTEKNMFVAPWIDWRYLKSRGWVFLVNKKKPNDNPNYPEYWFDEKQMLDFTYHRRHVSAIGQVIQGDSWKRRISADTLRKVADLIGYDENTHQLKEEK